MSIRTASSFERLTRRAWMAIGIVAFVIGLVTIVVISPLVDVFPSSYAIVSIIGAFAFLLGLWMTRKWYKGGVAQTTVPNVEKVLSTQAPGHDIDRALYELTEYRKGTIEYKDQIQDRLASVAVAIITHRDECSREEAVQMLQDGTWTDNVYAASFFTGSSPPKRALHKRIVNRYVGDNESAYERWVRITVDTLLERSGMEFEEPREEASGGLLSRLGLSGDDDDSEVVLTQASYRSATEKRDAHESRDGVAYAQLLQTGHWRGISGLALVCAGFGVILAQPTILLVSVLGVAFAAYARVWPDPQVANLDVTRAVTDRTPLPGDEVQVTVTVENEGGRFMPDVRLVDRVPGPMEVVDGSPRMATSLRPGGTATFQYTVVAERGTHEWPLMILARDVSGSLEREAAIDVETGLQCIPSLKTTSGAPVRSQTTYFTGQVNTEIGGPGLEFFSVREHQSGDPMKRIDWNRHARTGELATVEFRQEQAAKVVLLFDARESAFLSPEPGERHALDRSVDAGMELFGALFDRGDMVGVAAFDTVPCWLGPSAGDEHRERAKRIFSGHEAISSTPPDLRDVEGEYIDPMTHIRRQMSPESQLMIFSPLCDDYAAEVARRLDSIGHSVTIISPDPTTNGTIGQRLAQLEREMRIMDLRERGIRVVDWEYEELLRVELQRAQKRWVA